ncbi:MAG TPA: Holliday junction resolvase RuvX [Atribacteraceae bacterium]|nr:Holliday junction resolvase RuvX [Atribacteraceae bacterium]
MITTRMMALDLGTKRIGVALNRGTALAFPFSVIEHRSEETTIRAILDIARDNQVERILLGLPLRLSYLAKQEAHNVLRFQKKLQNLFSGEIIVFDERLTTKEAERRLLELDLRRDKRKKVIDQMAASILLQTYLDRAGA